MANITLRIVVFLFLFLYITAIHAQDSTFISVHFLYGSKAKKKFKAEEPHWFGGKLGGQVGIEFDSNMIVDFVPSGDFHVFGKKNDRHSQFAFHTQKSFWEIFGSPADSVKQASVVIPISLQQHLELDSYIIKYRNNTPYDYAFFGMRCGAAAYDLLGKIDIVKPWPYKKTSRKIFFPAKLRKRLFKMAERENWNIIRQEGTERRKWERD